jgi:quinol monooxygenase YgiN
LTTDTVAPRFRSGSSSLTWRRTAEIDRTGADRREPVFAILLRVEAKPGKELELLDFLGLDCETSSRLEPRTLRFDVLRDRTKDRSFYVYEAYEDADAFRDHQRNRPYRTWSSEGFQGEVLAAPPTELFRGAPDCITWPPTGERMDLLYEQVCKQSSCR